MLLTAEPPQRRALFLWDEWFLRSVLAYLEDNGHEIHVLWLLAVDDGLTSVRRVFKNHYSVSIGHARRLAMLHSWWSVLVKLATGASGVKFPVDPRLRLPQATVDCITEELDCVGIPTHPDRHQALTMAVSVDHVKKHHQFSSCWYCGTTRTHRCGGRTRFWVDVGTKHGGHFCHGSLPPIMYAAARHGRLETVVCLHFVACYDQEKALEEAAVAGHVEVVAWLLDHPHGTTVVVDFRLRDDLELGLMMWRGNLCGRYFVLSTKWGYLSSMSESAPICLAVMRGEIEDLRWFFAHWFFRPRFSVDVEFVAIQSGNLAALEFLFEHHSIGTTTSRLTNAVHSGHLEVAQWLVAHGRGRVDASIVEAAVRSKRLDILQWALQQIKDSEAVRETESRATNDGVTLTLLLVLEESTRKSTAEEVSKAIARATSDGTSLEVLQWLVEERGLELTVAHAKAAIWHNDPELTKWIVQRCIVKHTFTDSEVLVDTAIKEGNLALVRWFIQELGLWSSSAFQLASMGPSVDVLEYVHTMALAHGHVINPGLRRGLGRRHIDTIVWLLDHGFHTGVLSIFAPLGEILFMEKCYAPAHQELGFNSSSVVSPSTIHRVRDAVCLIAQVYDPEFVRRIPWLPKWAAQHGQLGVLQRLVELGERSFLTRRIFDRLLYDPGSQVVVRWFLEQKPTLFTTLVVRWAVTYGKHDLFRWIMQTLLPVLAKNDPDPALLWRKAVHSALRTAHRYGRADWSRELQQWTPVANDPTLYRPRYL